MDVDLDRLVVRHRNVAPMLSTLLGATHAAVRITDTDGAVILEREAGRPGRPGPGPGPDEGPGASHSKDPCAANPRSIECRCSKDSSLPECGLE